MQFFAGFLWYLSESFFQTFYCRLGGASLVLTNLIQGFKWQLCESISSLGINNIIILAFLFQETKNWDLVHRNSCRGQCTPSGNFTELGSEISCPAKTLFKGICSSGPKWAAEVQPVSQTDYTSDLSYLSSWKLHFHFQIHHTLPLLTGCQLGFLKSATH